MQQVARYSLARRGAVVLLVGLLVAAASGGGCLSYLVRAGCGQLEILRARQPISEVLANPQLPQAQRAALEHVLEVQRFAKNALALDPGDSYTLFADIGREAVAWNVSAAPELQLRPHTWWFPIVGTVPYLGFFSKEEARQKAAELQKEGLETSVRSVVAYSTLGWFSDPLLSSQVGLSRYYLTRVVIHESTHATLWFAGDVQFNESFASFVETRGALEYYKQKFGASSRAYLARVEQLDEGRRVSEIFHRRTRQLDRMYRSKLAVAEKRKRKTEILQELAQELRQAAPKFKHYDLVKMAAQKYNNAQLLSYLRYESGQSFFEREFIASGSNWSRFLEKMQQLRKLSTSERRKLLLRKNTRQKKT